VTIFCRTAGSGPQASEAALPAPVTVVSSLAFAEAILDSATRERLVVVDTDVPFADALAFTAHTVAHHPSVGVIIIRPALDLGEVQLAMRAGARDVLDISDTSGLAAACVRSLKLSHQVLPETHVEFEPAGDGKIITVFSAKGGAGKTTIATNLSVILNDGGNSRVCLVDLDLAFGDVAITLRLEPRVTIVDALAMTGLQPDDVDAILTNYRPKHDCLLAPVAPGDAEKIPATLTTTLLAALVQRYDYVVIDTPSQFSDHVLAALDASAHHLLITTPELPSLKNLRLTQDMFDLLGYDQASRSLALNRADENVGLSIADVVHVAGSPLAVRIPSSTDVPTSINRGVPLAVDQPEHPITVAIRRLAAETFAPELTVLGKHRARRMPRLLNRRTS
jgi:pilus assembly protein CpaE